MDHKKRKYGKDLIDWVLSFPKKTIEKETPHCNNFASMVCLKCDKCWGKK